MNVLIVFTLTLWAVCSSLAVDPEYSRFVLFRDDNGEEHLIDLEEEPSDVKYVPEEDIEYLLFTRKNPTTPQRIFKGDSEGLSNSNFDRTKPVKFTIHGWTGGANSGVNTAITAAYLRAMDVNVFTVNWNKGASGNYAASVLNVPPTGNSVGGFLDWLNTLGVPFSNFHVMGHSLGGHVAGITGRSATRGKVEYITGLDPAFPTWGSGSQRIRPTDGKYVEIIHTNGGFLGLKEPVGQNDFYPNGGVSMNGCSVTDTGCSHDRAFLYMADSIDHQGYKATLCGSVDQATSGQCTSTTTLHMGGSKIKPAMGLFALETNANAPYYKG